MQYSDLISHVRNSAALRRRQRLQPVGGAGDKIFPPTYPGEGRNAGPRHVFEVRRINGESVVCVLIDSVQSQANRLEEALAAAMREDGGPKIPHVVVDFRNRDLKGLTTITSLEAPHRVYDAILRDSEVGGVRFMETDKGRSLALATPQDASALLEVSPTALLFGAWHSTGGGGGLGAKFARVLVSEIVGVNVSVEGDLNDIEHLKSGGRRPGSRIDPLGILSDVEIYQAKDNLQDWTPNPNEAALKGKEPVKFSRKKGDKAGKPSVINHGNIRPSVDALGVTCDYAEHTAVLTFAGLRRLGFGGPPEKDTAGRALIAALGILALTEQDAHGYSLRSRCDLVCEGRAPLEVVRPDGSTQDVAISREAARALYAEALAAARKAGFTLLDEPLTLSPQDKLLTIIRKSQEMALQGQGGDETDAGNG